MHEYSIVQALLEQVDRVAQAHGAASVQRLHVRVGELSGVEVPLLTAAYAAFRERTICEHADLEIRPVAALWNCPRCERVVPRGGFLRCPDCGLPARLCQGDELVLDRIEMEVA